jgi:hypothetical protein
MLDNAGRISGVWRDATPRAPGGSPLSMSLMAQKSRRVK